MCHSHPATLWTDKGLVTWIKTNPGEGWFTILRLYGPLEPILEKKWKPNDIEKIK